MQRAQEPTSRSQWYKSDSTFSIKEGSCLSSDREERESSENNSGK